MKKLAGQLAAIARRCAQQVTEGVKDPALGERGSRTRLWVGLAIASIVLAAVATVFRVPASEPGGRGSGRTPEGPSAGQAEQPAPAPPPPLDARWRIDFGLSLAEKDGTWIFVIDGLSNLPPEVRLRARVYAVQVFSDFKEGKREDEEPLVWEDDLEQPGFRRFSIPNGKFREAVYAFARKPYSIPYRAKIEYVASEQTEPVRLKIGEVDFFRQADLRGGGDADFERELRERVREVADDLTEAQKLAGELSDSVAAFGYTFDARAWKEWKEAWRARVDALRKRNARRYSLWAVWMERQAKMRVSGLCDLLRMIEARAEEQFTGGAKTPVRIEELQKTFQDYTEEAIEAIGIDSPLDRRRVGPIVAAYEKAIAPVRAWILKASGGDDGNWRSPRQAALGALQDLIPLLKNRRRGYFYVTEVSMRLTALLDLLEASSSPEVLIQGLKEHDAAVAAFEGFAGLK